jgi:hypothetical protein
MTIIPANPGFELLCGSIECGKVEVYAPRPILAWRITEHGPIPIALDLSVVGRQMTVADYISMSLPEGGTPSLRYAVRHGGTIYDATIGGEFDSEEDWREWLLTGGGQVGKARRLAKRVKAPT